MFGSNVPMLEHDCEINQALTLTSDWVSEAARVTFDAGRANLSRVHFCHNFQMLPKDVLEYIKAASNTSIPRTVRTVCDNRTVQFSNGARAVVLYDKLSEVMSKLSKDEATNEDVAAATGVLRLETRFEDRRACKRLALRHSLSNTGGALLTMKVATGTLDETIDELGLNETVEGSEARLARLMDYYDPERAQILAGFMVFCDSFGAENLIRLGYCKKATFYQRRKALKAAGVWLHSGAMRRLPPLRLVVPRTKLRAQVA